MGENYFQKEVYKTLEPINNDRSAGVYTSEDLEAEVKQTLETLRGDLRAIERFRGNALERLSMVFLAINMVAIPLHSDCFPFS